MELTGADEVVQDLAKRLPVIWMPTTFLQLSMINSHLQGTGPQDPLANIYPENWSWS